MVPAVAAYKGRLLLVEPVNAVMAKFLVETPVSPPLLVQDKICIKYQLDKLAQLTKFWPNTQAAVAMLNITLITLLDNASPEPQLATVLNGWLPNKVNSMVSQLLGATLIVTLLIHSQLVYILLAVLSYIKLILMEPASWPISQTLNNNSADALINQAK